MLQFRLEFSVDAMIDAFCCFSLIACFFSIQCDL
ncbi:MAG: hypothetical protein ACI9B8_001432 [Sulfitobacter sp.]|jgi:hypothetical protein